MILCAVAIPTRLNISLPQDGSLHFRYRDRAVAMSFKHQQGLEVVSFNGDNLDWLTNPKARIARVNAIKEGKKEPVKYIYFSDNGIVGTGEKTPKLFSIIWVFFELESSKLLDDEISFGEIAKWVQDCVSFLLDHYLAVTSDNDIPRFSLKCASIFTVYTATHYKFASNRVEAELQFSRHIFNWESPEKTGHLKELIPDDWITDLQTRLASGVPIPIYERLLLDAKRQTFYAEEHELSIILAETAFETFVSLELKRFCDKYAIRELDVGSGKKVKVPVEKVLEKESISNLLNYITLLTQVKVKANKEHKSWHDFAYAPRNLIVHRGAKGFKAEDAQKAFFTIVRYMNLIRKALHVPVA